MRAHLFSIIKRGVINLTHFAYYYYYYFILLIFILILIFTFNLSAVCWYTK